VVATENRRIGNVGEQDDECIARDISWEVVDGGVIDGRGPEDEGVCIAACCIVT
jgi:hypothetical protein